jgi:hypothetical protein
MSARPRRREGRGLGETLSESFIFILMAVGLVAAGYWYFAIYKKSPQVALQNFLGYVNAGNPEGQYSYLADSSKKYFGSESAYKDKYPLAYGLSARLASYAFQNEQLSGDTWKTDVLMNVRKKTAEIMNTASDSYTDHYVLRKEPDGWKIVLEKSQIDRSHTEGK